MNLQDLSSIKERILADVLEPAEKTRVLVGLATCGIASGAAPVMDKFKALAEGNDKVFVSQTGCVGICQYEPVVEVITPDKKKTLYVKVTPEKAEQIYNEHVLGGKPVESMVVGTVLPSGSEEVAMSLEETVFLKKQTRVALRNCGHIDPEEIDQYIATDGYQALNKVLTTMSPDDVIQTMLDSGLRGRGGAGFPTGLKWKFASGNRGNVQKYVCCNADEGDPGAFMDRSVLEGDPHAVLEAMAIAGYAIGASMGYIYVRAEYPLAITRLRIAIEQAKEKGVLGDNIFGTDFSFDIDLRLGSGAFVCGEETALMTSIEGNRGEPRPRPPFPAVKGLFQKPTILNNVETWANIPRIIMKGADWFSGMGTEKSKGTKVFCLGGKINNTGLVEIEMGTTLREVIEEIGGGIPNGKAFKAAQTGGPSGGCISTVNYDVPIDYDNLISIGSMMGSGGLIVMDEDNCMVDIAKFFLDFTVDESCGKCTPCRIGTKRLYEIMEKITKGEANMKDLEHLDELAHYIKEDALCGLGQTAPNPVLSTLRYFHDEYEAHIKQRKCPAGVCKELLHYNINPHKCVGCGLCKSKCPADAIIGMLRKPHVINPEICIRCGTCITVCKQNAVEIV
ncbi:MAG: NADH-quinone oxidoreductase subunit NuoF [Lachnospiraceae bacterium]|nr:NADH-quinone oxidoreductase subunit NuoF [Lachnospiraceae bacterium]